MELMVTWPCDVLYVALLPVGAEGDAAVGGVGLVVVCVDGIDCVGCAGIGWLCVCASADPAISRLVPKIENNVGIRFFIARAPYSA